MKAYIFPGQGAQFPGMGKDLYDKHSTIKDLFHQANDILGFDIQSIMFSGIKEYLQQTKVTQPAIFLHSVAAAKTINNFHPDAVAGHSLGEFSALVAAQSLTFEDGLKLVSRRALAMQHACEAHPSSMAAILGLADEIVEEVCNNMDELVVAANYNCPGQLVISGESAAVEKACEILKEKGARRALLLPVHGAFHSPIMELAKKELAEAIEHTHFSEPICPVYQNVTTTGVTDATEIQQNLVLQLTTPVKWTQSVQNMWKDGMEEYVELGPGKVLQGLVKKIQPEAIVSGIS